MSLLPSVPSGSPLQPYYISNIGSAAAPVIGADSNGRIRVGNPVDGLVLKTDASGNGFVRGGAANNGELTLGSDATSFANITLTSGAIEFVGDITSSGDQTIYGNVDVTGSASVTGTFTADSGINVASSDLTFTGIGDVVFDGGSISGYYNATTPSASYADGVDTPIANPAGLSEGWYIIGIATAPGAQAEEQVSTIAHWSGTLWDIGGACQSVAGAGSFGLKPADNRTQMRVHNATGAAQIATVQWAKLMN